MMKFTIRCVRQHGARLGELTEVCRHGNQSLETPMCMLYTRGGSAPYLTCDMLGKIHDVPMMTHMMVNQLVEYTETIEAYKEGMAKFSALKDHLVFTSQHDPAVAVPKGFNDKSSVGVFGKGGKTKLDVDQFMKVQSAILPDWIQCLCDQDTQKDSGNKRCMKSVERTLKFLDDIVDQHEKSERLRGSSLFGSIVGGYGERERQRSAKETSARPVDGFVIDGFHSAGPDTEQFNITDVGDLISGVMKQLPDDKPRLMQCVWRPDAVMDAIDLGIDIFDTSYPYIVTERGCALAFKHKFIKDPEQNGDDASADSGYSMDLNEKRYADDFTPLLKDCPCYACRNFTRAYINHLLNTSELLGNTLLMMHNFHHYIQFFVSIRESLADDTFYKLKDLIGRQKLSEPP